MAQNIELKARANAFAQQQDVAAQLAQDEAQIIEQRDTFYKVDVGRLKLRRFADDTAELIYYRRDDSTGPTLSEYVISKALDPDSLHEILNRAYGVIAQVNKCRLLYLVGRTRLHFDVVESLGEFIELEVVLEEFDTLKEGQNEANNLMNALNIKTEDLIDVAYADLIAQNI